MSQAGKGSFHPWGLAALSAAFVVSIVAGLATGYIQGVITKLRNHGQVSADSHAASGPVSLPSNGLDRVQNLQLSLSPATISIAKNQFTTIEVDDATPNTFVDIEIAQPTYLGNSVGGVCPKITKGPCNLAYSGGGEANRTGTVTVDFPEQAGSQLYAGTYVVTVRDRHTAATVSLDLEVNP